MPADSTALVVDWISWSRQARGTTSRLARAVTLSLRKFMAMGKPACFLMRVSTPRAGWHHVMKDWKPLITHHCLCEYTRSRNTPHVKMRSYSSGLQVYSNTCRHVDETTDMSYPERDQSAQTLLSKWVLAWLIEWGGSPEGEGEPSSSCPAPLQGGRQAELGGPQQPPHSRRYLETLEKDTLPAYPTDAKEREKSRRKSLKAQGKAHVVRKRTVTVEEHFDDCGEDLSSLKGAETIAAWTSSIFEDAHHGLEDEAHSAICDGLERVILNDTAANPQRLLAGVTRYAALGEVPPGRLLQHPWVEIAEFQAAPQSVLLTVRRQLDDHQVSDFVAPLDIQ